MPRTLVRTHTDQERIYSLGWLATAWMEYFVVHGPGDVQGEPVSHGDEYTGFIVDCYMQTVAASNNHMQYDSAFLSRPKGCDKSGMGARLALFEALGPARFAGWAKGGEVYRDPWGLGFKYVYSPGEPMGRHVKAPFIRCLATEETQVGNVYASIYYNLTQDEDDPPLSYVPGLDVGVDRVLLPGGGEIRVSTASSSGKDGGKETFVVLDETHLYTTRVLRTMYRTVTRNLRKRKKGSGTWFFECTTMFAPGEDSSAEKTFEEATALMEGRKKRGRHRLLYDHRWGECLDPADEVELRMALREAYGDALLWMDIDSLVDEFYDLRNEEGDSRRFFLNAQTSVNDAWMDFQEWRACKRPDRALKKRDMVTLGLDGAVRDDSTGIVACRVSDGHLEAIGLWEKPEGAAGDGWQVDREEVDAKVAWAMSHFEVVGFFADPPHWADYIDRWNSQWGEKMQVRASAKRPLEWWTNRGVAMAAALDRFREAASEQRISYTPAEDRAEGTDEYKLALAFSRHINNARRRERRGGIQIAKETPKSKKKIDLAMCAVLAYEAACDARAAGIKPKSASFQLPKRIR